MTNRAAEKNMIVLAVPMAGMRTRTGKNVPTTLPIVEIPKMRPAETPTRSVCATIRVRKGLDMPRITIGGENSKAMAESDPRNMNEKDESRLPMRDESHRTTVKTPKGSRTRNAQAARSNFNRISRRGFRSASFPPNM